MNYMFFKVLYRNKMSKTNIFLHIWKDTCSIFLFNGLADNCLIIIYIFSEFNLKLKDLKYCFYIIYYIKFIWRLCFLSLQPISVWQIEGWMFSYIIKGSSILYFFNCEIISNFFWVNSKEIFGSDRSSRSHNLRPFVRLSGPSLS